MQLRSSAWVLAVVTAAVASSAARADEGMWTFNNFPAAAVQKAYGFTPSKDWLDRVRLGSARLAQGCSASFVSEGGLVMTNHHCVHECVEQLSTKSKDFIANGFVAKSTKDEVKCPALEVNQLVEITDITERLKKATAGKTGAAFSEAQKVEEAKITKACATDDATRCDVVNLYHGGVYNLYKYKRYQDVRLAFAPELAIAFFGGDPDNFNFPRYDLDAAFVRVYEGGKPLQTKTFLPFAKQPLKAGDVTFVSGHPGRTSREETLAQLSYQRDVALPSRLLYLAEMRGMLTEFANRGKEQERTSKAALFSVENGFKALKGRHQALLDAGLWSSKVNAEAELLKKAKGDTKKKAETAIKNIDAAMQLQRDLAVSLGYLEQGRAFQSEHFQVARALVRAADELTKKNEERSLPEFSDAALPGLKQELFSEAPIYPEFEIAKLTFSLTKMREIMGSDDPTVKKVLGKKSPAVLAKELVTGTKLASVKERQRLFDGGKAAIDASKDPFIVLAKLIDGEARAVRKRYEDDVKSVLDREGEVLAQARFQAFGTSVYPDATFTLRLSFGSAQGWKERGVDVPALTTVAGAFERHTGFEPYNLPKSWLAAQSKLDATTPMNVATTNDIIGGNSGSPVINKDGEVVGLIFDGNIHSLGGEYGFDAAKNRAVAVHTSVILEALEKVYGAGHLAAELKGQKPQG